MDARHFDQIAKSLSSGGTRRGMLHLLTLLPFGGVLAFLLGDDPSDAKRRKQGNRQGSKGHQRGKRRVGGENHKHEGRRRKHNLSHKHHHKKKKKRDTDKGCQPESAVQTCDGKCGTVTNNCEKPVDCGSCNCDPACPACQVCDEETRSCVSDTAQGAESCGGCRICQDGQCVIDASVVCTALDQCHEAGECDPETGECTNPRKPDDTPCDDEDACTTGDSCQNGVCTGTAKDCSAEDDVCNDGACRSAVIPAARPNVATGFAVSPGSPASTTFARAPVSPQTPPAILRMTPVAGTRVSSAPNPRPVPEPARAAVAGMKARSAPPTATAATVCARMASAASQTGNAMAPLNAAPDMSASTTFAKRHVAPRTRSARISRAVTGSAA